MSDAEDKKFKEVSMSQEYRTKTLDDEAKDDGESKVKVENQKVELNTVDHETRNNVFSNRTSVEMSMRPSIDRNNGSTS